MAQGLKLGGFKLFHLLGKRPKCLVKLYVLAYPIDGAGPGVAGQSHEGSD
jgi:hypothetical protein